MRTKRPQRPDLTQNPWSPATARQIVAEWQRSGLTLTEYARRIGTTRQRMNWWRRRFEASPSTRAAKPASMRAPAPAVFVPAEVTSSTGPRTVVVRIARGIEIEAGGVDALPATWLAAVARELARSA